MSIFRGIYMNIIKHIDHRMVLSAFLCLGMGAASVSAQTLEEVSAASGVDTSVAKDKVYALVNGKPITFFEYNAELIALLKNRYYHGKLPEGKEEETRKELTDSMVSRILLVEEAERRGIKPDEAAIERVIARLDARGKLNGPGRDQLIIQIRDIEGKKSQIKQLEKRVRDVPPPNPDEIKAYYDQHTELFTEPEKLRLSVILVSVDPSSPVATWAEALNTARGIYNQVKNGADFAELARKISGDKSAANGGDLGYLHRGMLPKGLDDKVDKFQVGVVVEPIKMLEGMAVFRLEDRIPPTVHSYDEKKEQAKELLLREKQDHAWQETIDRLRKTAKIEFFQQPGTESVKQP
jgi:parvulin-like peptidyl-prolyl isomerase